MDERNLIPLNVFVMYCSRPRGRWRRRSDGDDARAWELIGESHCRSANSFQAVSGSPIAPFPRLSRCRYCPIVDIVSGNTLYIIIGYPTGHSQTDNGLRETTPRVRLSRSTSRGCESGGNRSFARHRGPTRSLPRESGTIQKTSEGHDKGEQTSVSVVIEEVGLQETGGRDLRHEGLHVRRVRQLISVSVIASLTKLRAAENGEESGY